MRDSRLTTYAKANRKQMTEPATRMWLQLRAQRFMGIKFRREKVIGSYIADFAANEPKLVIEIDGQTHDVDDQYDADRTRFLETQGYRVVRYTNLEVMQNLEGVLIHLAAVIGELRPPLPTLSPEGERAILKLNPQMLRHREDVLLPPPAQVGDRFRIRRTIAPGDEIEEGRAALGKGGGEAGHLINLTIVRTRNPAAMANMAMNRPSSRVFGS